MPLLPSRVAPLCGLYLIRLSDTHYYGGRSEDVARRWRKHLRDLNRGCHDNSRMQAVFNLHGRFEPELIVEAPAGVALEAIEQQWLDENFRQPGCVNLSRSADGGMMRGRRHSEETRQKMSLTRKGKPGVKPSPETRAKMSESGKNRAPMSAETLRKVRAHRHTDETKAKMAASHTGMVFTEEHRRNMSLHHVGTTGKKLPGRVLSEEHRRKIAESWERRRLQKGGS